MSFNCSGKYLCRATGENHPDVYLCKIPAYKNQIHPSWMLKRQEKRVGKGYGRQHPAIPQNSAEGPACPRHAGYKLLTKTPCRRFSGSSNLRIALRHQTPFSLGKLNYLSAYHVPCKDFALKLGGQGLIRW